MADFPSIAGPGSLTQDDYLPQVKTEFEAGYVQSRPRHTRARHVFKLSWNAVTAADYATLEAFFEAQQGNTFTWTHPVSETEYTVRFADDRLSPEFISPGYWRVSLTLEEN